jgi:hypothetical protein
MKLENYEYCWYHLKWMRMQVCVQVLTSPNGSAAVKMPSSIEAAKMDDAMALTPPTITLREPADDCQVIFPEFKARTDFGTLGQHHLALVS